MVNRLWRVLARIGLACTALVLSVMDVGLVAPCLAAQGAPRAPARKLAATHALSADERAFLRAVEAEPMSPTLMRAAAVRVWGADEARFQALGPGLTALYVRQARALTPAARARWVSTTIDAMLATHDGTRQPRLYDGARTAAMYQLAPSGSAPLAWVLDTALAHTPARAAAFESMLCAERAERAAQRGRAVQRAMKRQLRRRGTYAITRERLADALDEDEHALYRARIVAANQASFTVQLRGTGRAQGDVWLVTPGSAPVHVQGRCTPRAPAGTRAGTLLAPRSPGLERPRRTAQDQRGGSER